MEGPVFNVLWFGWAFVCALGVRVGFTHLFRPRLGDAAKIAAYGMWIVLLLIGWAVVSLSGMQMYGFDANDPRQTLGYITFLYSPLGLPTAFGAPAVLALDLLVAAAKDMKAARLLTFAGLWVLFWLLLVFLGASTTWWLAVLMLPVAAVPAGLTTRALFRHKAR